MSVDLVINARDYETRVALVENGTVTELYIERSHDRSIAGNIYLGRVARVIPGMQAAFVDIGLDKAAFLYVGDLKHLSPADNPLPEAAFPQAEEEAVSIEKRLTEGQDVLVQVAKEPLGSKGARISTHITLPGRNLVLLPGMNHVGISRRIDSEKERERLRETMTDLKPGEMGFIIRTAAEGETNEKLEVEMDFLLKLWDNILERSSRTSGPTLIHQDLDITLRAVRDLFVSEADRVIIDNEKEHERILDFAETFIPSLKGNVTLYRGDEPIFDHLGIEMEINRALSKKVWLKSGGYIVIEETEALTAIDVNTGRFVGSRRLEDTLLKTNLEAAKEIACQLRLRNIGGIIIIDFIDMEEEASREKVFATLKEELGRDRSKTNLLKMSEMGLIEMTRKRTKESIGRTLLKACPYCDGEANLKSPLTVTYEILRRLERERRQVAGREVLITAHPAVAHFLLDEERENLIALEMELQTRISVKGDPGLHQEHFKVEPF